VFRLHNLHRRLELGRCPEVPFEEVCAGTALAGIARDQRPSVDRRTPTLGFSRNTETIRARPFGWERTQSEAWYAPYTLAEQAELPRR
jgi:hypothetical protein